MIIVRLMGGLGNQMFQYAAARRLALRHGAEVAFDLSAFDEAPSGDTPRKFELHHLSVSARLATPLETAEMSGAYRSALQKAHSWLRRVTGQKCYSRNVFVERDSSFCSEVLNLPDNVYLRGYWQSEKYFQDVTKSLRDELMVRNDPSGRNRELLSRISATQSVAVHFRRGDYANNPETSAYHGTPSPEYYRQAISFLCERVENPFLYVFSDEPEWVKQNMAFSVPAEIVDHNPPEMGYEDLRLMSSCKHAIIANSSFSWWGAWLIRNPDKLVIAPHRWLNRAEDSISDRLPPGWLQVKF